MAKQIESRRIWFWQKGRYLDRGWNINQTTFRGTSPLCWPEALTDLARPWAVRSEPDRARPWATAPDYKTSFERVLGVAEGSRPPHQIYRALGMHAALSHMFGPPDGVTLDQLAEGYAAQIEAFAERVASGDVIGALASPAAIGAGMPRDASAIPAEIRPQEEPPRHAAGAPAQPQAPSQAR